MTESKKKWLWASGLFAALFIIAAITCWNVLQDPEQVLAFNDGSIEVALCPAYHLPEALRRIWDNQSFFGAGGKCLMFSLNGTGEFFGPSFVRRTGQPLLLALCGLAIFWALRQYRINRSLAAISAAIVVSTGWGTSFSFTGLAVRPLVLSFTFLAIGFAEHGRLSRRWLPYAIGGGCLGLAVSESADVGAILAVGAAFVFWWTHLAGVRSQKSEVRSQQPEPTGLRSRVYGLESTVSCLLSSLPRFALFVAFSVLLAWQTISVMFATQIQGVSQGTEETPAARYAWATQWSIPPAELWNTVSGSYFGTTMRSDTTPYWGRMGRSEGWEKTKQGFRNFSLTGWHLGVIPCVLLIALPVWMVISRNGRTSLVDARRRQHAPPPHFVWMICTGCVLALMLMVGKYFFAYRLLWMLPYFDTIRNPDKWNGPFLLFAGLGIAFMLNILWQSLTEGPATSRLGGTPRPTMPNNLDLGRARRPAEPSLVEGCLFQQTASDSKKPRASRNAQALMDTLVAPWRAIAWTSAGMAVLALLIVIWTQTNKTGFLTARARDGYGDTATLMWNNALNASFKVFLLAVIFGGMAFWITRRLRHGKSTNPWLFLGIAAALSLGDLMVVNRAYSMPHKYRQYFLPNPLSDFLDAHRTDGRVKLMPAQHPLLNNLRLSLLQIKGYDLFDPISVSRMPADHESLFKALEAQTSRLWELGAVRYFLTLPGAAQQLNQMDGNRGRFVERLAMGIGVVNDSYLPVGYAPPDQQYLRLVEFTGALPFYRLVSKVNYVPDTVAGGETALKRLADPGFDDTQEAIVHKDNPLEIPAATSTGTVTILKHDPAEATIRVTTEQPQFLIRAVKYDPDWKVTIDDQPATLYRANYLFQGIVVPSGQHTLRFAYSPSLMPSAIALASRGFLLFLLAVHLWQRRRHHATVALADARPKEEWIG